MRTTPDRRVMALRVVAACMLGLGCRGEHRAGASIEPEIVAPGVLSTDADEFGLVVAPDGRTAWFTLRTPTTNTPPRSVICVTHRDGDHWGRPEVATFSGRFNDFGVAMAPDGARLYFASDRPTGVGGGFDLWVMERHGDAWDAPQNVGVPVNSVAAEVSPAVAADGTLYFASNRDGGKGGLDLYRARRTGDAFGTPENLAALNTAASESQPAVAADQSFVVFVGLGREDQPSPEGHGAPYPRADLYVARLTGGGSNVPRRLLPPINGLASESSPSLSPDGKWLYFASERGFASVPMPRPVTASEFAAGLRGICNGRYNLYRVGIEALRRGAAATPEGG